MANLDLDLINRPAAYQGQPVPKEMDLHMIKYITGLRKKAVEQNPNLITMEPNDHSDVFYDARTHLNKLGYDTSLYNDNVAGGTDRRKDFYSKIKDVCENYHHVKRHQIGIFPEDRAIMAYEGYYYSVGFESLKRLMVKGTDVVVVEKAGTVLKMVPFTKNRGVAFIQSQGFVSEYGVALAQLSQADYQTCKDYADNYKPRYVGHLGVLMDCDANGVLIGLKIPGAVKIGLDLNSISEMILYNKRLGINLTDKLDMNALVEGKKLDTHWDGLNGIIQRKKRSNAYSELLDYGGSMYVDKCIKYLSQKVKDPLDNTTTIPFIEWLETNRIELNTVLSAIEPEPFWNWLRFKLLTVWPNRDYNRVFHEPSPSDVYTPEINNFITRLDNTYTPLIEERYKPIQEQLSNIKGFIKNTEGTKKLIQSTVSKKIAKDNEKIRLLGERLEALADEFNLADLDTDTDTAADN
ncbi:MAG: hypothetical protein WBQ25_22750 [Nitrososphaeraceae archaeon]